MTNARRPLILLTALALTAALFLVHTTHAANLSFGCDLALTAPLIIKPKPKTTGARIATFSSGSFDFSKEAELNTGADIIFVDEPTEREIRLGLEAGYLNAPYEITWNRNPFPAGVGLSGLDAIQRDNLDFKLAESEGQVRTVIGLLSAKDIEQWSEVNATRLNSDPDWTNARINQPEDEYFKFFFYDRFSGQLLGGAILRRKGKFFSLFAEAYREEVRELSLEFRAYYEISQYIVAHNATGLFYGSDPNFYGGDLPVQRVTDKSLMGLSPIPRGTKTRLVKVLNPNAFNRDYVIFARSHRANAVSHHFTDQPRNLFLVDRFYLQVHKIPGRY